MNQEHEYSVTILRAPKPFGPFRPSDDEKTIDVTDATAARAACRAASAVGLKRDAVVRVVGKAAGSLPLLFDVKSTDVGWIYAATPKAIELPTKRTPK